MKQNPIYDLNLRLDRLEGITNKHFMQRPELYPKRIKRELFFNYKGYNIRVVQSSFNQFYIFVDDEPQINKFDTQSNTTFDSVNEVIKFIQELSTKLEEKASIDWNNYLTKDEVKKFLSKDDKIESAEDIIYSKEFEPRYKDLHNNLQAKYKNSWTRKELIQDLNEFYNFGHLIIESKNKIEEASRNELLAQAKEQTISRYKRSEGYKGFYIYDIDTSNLFTKESPLLITCRVGNYHSQIEIQDVLLWIQLRAEENQEKQINTKNVTQALSDSIDGMDIKVNCECRRLCI